MSDGGEQGDSTRDGRAPDDEDVDRRAILRRRALLVSTALAGVTLSVLGAETSPVCMREAHAQRAPRAARRDAGAVEASVIDAASATDATSASPATDELPDVEELPLEVIDATIRGPVPSVCLSPLPPDPDPPNNGGCGCRRSRAT